MSELWISGDLSKSASGLAYWIGIRDPVLVDTGIVPELLPEHMAREWWHRFGHDETHRTDYAALVIEAGLGHRPNAALPLAEHRGTVIARWHDVQGYEKPVLRQRVKVWREAVRKVLPCGSFAAGAWTWPAGAAAKERAIEVVNQSWSLGLGEDEDDKAEAVLVGWWAHVSGTLRAELDARVKRAAKAAEKEAKAAKRARKA